VSRLDTNRKELNLVPAQQLQVESLIADIKDIVPVKLCLVNKTAQEETWDRLVHSYHYLGYKKMYGPRIKYLAMHSTGPVAALSFNRATLRVGVRDRYVGWDDELKNEHLDRVVCNNRFLILPWVRVPNLASHLLAQALKQLPEDWLKLYGRRIFMVETFVDSAKYSGSCYKAAGFKLLGQTKGFAKAGPNYIYHGNKKAVFIKVIDQGFLLNSAPGPIPAPLEFATRKEGAKK